nr:uncharacterized protein LOC129424440 [Misgurnus anguillicaudatus]
MQTMARSVVWSRGRLLDPETANSILDHVSEFLDALETLPQQDVLQAYSAPLVRGSSGRPQLSITQEQLQFLLEYNFSTKQMAEILGVSKRTVKRRLRKFSISLRDRYTDMSDSDLDNQVRELVGGNDELGAESVRERLAGQGLIVQRHRVRQSLIRTNPVGAAQRVTTRRLHRRVYKVAGPNALWHLDGNHKLIRWRIVIHGGIDGYSRLVVFLKASDNNRSNTVFESFVDAIGKHGIPSRVRCDNGGENNSVCLFMNVFRGSTRGSALRGRSTHNQRIERLWVMFGGASPILIIPYSRSWRVRVKLTLTMKCISGHYNQLQMRMLPQLPKLSPHILKLCSTGQKLFRSLPTNSTFKKDK